MFQSLKIGRWFGIDLFVHPTFWLLPLIVLASSYAVDGLGHAALDVAVILAAFGCIALHEFGHALAARWYGIATRDITLYPIGGVARLEGMPDRPWPEIVVALAGPAVNVVIAGLIGAMLILDGVVLGEAVTAAPSLDAFWTRLLFANVGLVIFNLIPAFPMDGGRVFRAAVHWFTDRVTATEVAAAVGTVFAVLMVAVGLYTTNLMLVVVAAFVFLTGRAELEGVRQQEEERRAERRAARRVPIARPVAETIDGWEWDPANRVWTEWRNGVPVRRLWAD
jgi:Zn-dependent protease